MADVETQDTIESTALTVVQAQQNIVGSAMVGASDSAMIVEPVERTTELLERLTEINMLMLKNLNEIFATLRETLGLDKLQDRRAKEDQTELDKENMNNDGGVGGSGNDINPQDADQKTGGFFGFLGGLPGAGFLTKIIAPITAFFGKSGLLVKLFGKFGPLGALILGFTLLYKYSDEISKALAPALDKIKELFVKLQPAIDVLKQFGDFLMKGIIEGIGEAISFLIGTVEKFIDGITKIFDGDIMGGLNDIFEGIVRTILAVPLTIINFLKPLFLDIIDYIAEPWNNMVTNVNQYISDTFIAISDYFIELKDKFVGFFVEAYNTVKQTITDAVQGAFNFIADIFNSISDFMSESYTKAKNFVTSLPDKILGFITNMFSPIIDFFNAIGNRIKSTINGVIDALPLPEFVKKKIRFDVEPTQDELDTETDKAFEKLEAPNTADEQFNKSGEFFAMVNKHKDDINKFMKATGYSFDLQGSKYQFEKGAGKYFSFDRGGEGYMTPANDFNAQDSIDFINSGKTIGFADVKSAPTDTKTNIADVGSLESNGPGVTVVNNNYNTNNSSVANQTDVHSGALDTGIDSYHDKLATASF